MNVDEPVLRRNEGESLAWREFEDEVLALDLHRSVYLRFNRAGALLWERLGSDGATRSELINALMEAFPVDAETAAADVDAFVSSCRERGLVLDA